MTDLIHFILKFDEHLRGFVDEYGAWTYAILFAIIFCETGLVVMPLLPGDSLLFAVGMYAAQKDSPLDIWTALGLLMVAAILGDTVNYHIGKYLGPKVLSGKFSRWLNPKHLERTQHFFEKYGGKTIILARFVPIVRTFAPFVAGVGSMNYSRFLLFNVIGAVVWVGVCMLAGYWLGEFDLVKHNFEIAVLLIIAVSLLPAVVEFLIHRFGKKPDPAVDAPN